MDSYRILKREIRDLYEEISEKMAEFTTNIHGYPETMSHDIIYEEAANFLNIVKARLETIVELLEYDESIQENNK